MNLRFIPLGGFACLLLLAAACSGRKPDRLPPHAKRFAAVYAELARMRGRISLSDSAYADSAEALIRRMRYTPDDFRKSVAYFNETPERWAAFYREVTACLNANKSAEAAPR